MVHKINIKCPDKQVGSRMKSEKVKIRLKLFGIV